MLPGFVSGSPRHLCPIKSFILISAGWLLSDHHNLVSSARLSRIMSDVPRGACLIKLTVFSPAHGMIHRYIWRKGLNMSLVV